MTAPPEDATAHRIARILALRPSEAYQALAHIASEHPGYVDNALEFCDDMLHAELGEVLKARAAEAAPVTENVSGRDQPRPSGGPVTHDLQFRPEIAEDDYGAAAVIRVTCTCGDGGPPYRRTFTESYTLEQLTRLAVQHEQEGTP